MPQTEVLHTCSLCGVVAPECDEYRLPRGWIVQMHGEGPTPAETKWIRSTVCTKHREELDRGYTTDRLAYLQQEVKKLDYKLVAIAVSRGAAADEAMNALRIDHRKEGDCA